MSLRFRVSGRLAVPAFVVYACLFCCGQASSAVLVSAPGMTPVSGTPSDEDSPGTISGTVLDQSGAVVAGARVSLKREGQSQSTELLSGDNGQFSFSGVAPGPFRLTVTAVGFATQTASGVLQPGENYLAPVISLSVAMNVTDVVVGVPTVEVASEQIRVEEKQRVLGIMPNFYVSYVRNAAPLSPKQKFQLAAKTAVDPFTLLIVGGTAGVQQAENHFREYGQGAQGYAKRFGADYADTLTGAFIGGAILPSILKQDPRYFYKGTGTKTSRFMYAVANAVICKGDNGHWQVNYSGILGSLAAGGISNLYYPSQNREGADLTFENAGVGIGASAIFNVFQEFVVRKFTPKAPHNDPANP